MGQLGSTGEGVGVQVEEMDVPYREAIILGGNGTVIAREAVA